jgi:spore germination cell wall hydrolase CwlJ-like protein
VSTYTNKLKTFKHLEYISLYVSYDLTCTHLPLITCYIYITIFIAESHKEYRGLFIGVKPFLRRGTSTLIRQLTWKAKEDKMKKNAIKSILLTTTLTIGLSFSVSADAYAATYKTVNGDSLYKISRLFNTTVGNLMDDNNLRNYNLSIGQELYVPCQIYSVQKGDTLYLISKKFNIELTDLRRANNIYTNYIDIGQVLNIPKTFAAKSAAEPAAEQNSVPAVVPAPEVAKPAVEPVQTVNTTVVAVPEAKVETVSYTAEDLDILSRLIMAEAQGQPYDAQVAVGAVVMNRVESNLWPNTIKDVVYHYIGGYYQFTPVQTGWINNPANAQAVQAAKEALNGADPTNGAMFYYDNTTTNQWILSKQVAFKSGAMIYSY